MNAGTNAHMPNPNPDKPEPKNSNREDRNAACGRNQLIRRHPFPGRTSSVPMTDLEVGHHKTGVRRGDTR
jgi:hypothetical protein